MKWKLAADADLEKVVTLCVRVWIEIGLESLGMNVASVTLCVRVWIEIMVILLTHLVIWSPSA